MVPERWNLFVLIQFLRETSSEAMELEGKAPLLMTDPPNANSAPCKYRVSSWL